MVRLFFGPAEFFAHWKILGRLGTYPKIILNKNYFTRLLKLRSYLFKQFKTNIPMKQKNDFPFFIIDRTKPESYPFDFVVCTDSQFGFIAKIIHYTSELTFNSFISLQEEITNSEFYYDFKKLKVGGLVLIIERFTYEFEFTEKALKRVQWCMKKALSKFIFAEVQRTPQGDLDIDNQIKQQKLSIERAKSQYNALVARSSVEEADYAIKLAEATLFTLEQAKERQIYFITGNN